MSYVNLYTELDQVFSFMFSFYYAHYMYLIVFLIVPPVICWIYIIHNQVVVYFVIQLSYVQIKTVLMSKKNITL